MDRPTIRTLRRALLSRVLAANMLAAALTAMAIELSEPTEGVQEDVPAVVRIVLSISATAVLAAVLASVGMWRLRRREAALWRWLDERRSPTPEERDLVLGEPWRGARELLLYWLAATVFVGLLFLVNIGPGRTVLSAMGATALGGLTATAVSFFLGERALRPGLVLALAGEPPAEASRFGVRRRIVVAWALGSGVPLAWIALVPLLRHPTSSVSAPFLTTLLALTGLAAGAAMAYLLGGSVGGPVEQVRRGMQKVERGELDASVAVDDVGELGILEAGFNRMAESVAERDRLQDLFGRHVGVEVARRALEQGIDLAGEVRQVSALFVDVVGSTSMATRLPAPEVVILLNEFFSEVVDAVTAEGGWINKFEGDAALCVFGAPGKQPDHAARALRAARRLTRRTSELDAGVGVSTGMAVAGNIGTEARLEYTIIGHAVNEAARLVEHAKSRDGRVLASAAAVQAAGSEAEHWVPAGDLQLRGIAEPVTVYEPR